MGFQEHLHLLIVLMEQEPALDANRPFQLLIILLQFAAALCLMVMLDTPYTQVLVKGWTKLLMEAEIQEGIQSQKQIILYQELDLFLLETICLFLPLWHLLKQQRLQKMMKGTPAVKEKSQLLLLLQMLT